MATNAAAGKCLGAHAALASRASISRRARLAPSRVPARQTRGRAATRAGPEDQLGTGNGDDLNYNVLAERMKALQAKESADTNEAVDAAIEREQAIIAGIRGDAADRQLGGRARGVCEGARRGDAAARRPYTFRRLRQFRSNSLLQRHRVLRFENGRYSDSMLGVLLQPRGRGLLSDERRRDDGHGVVDAVAAAHRRGRHRHRRGDDRSRLGGLLLRLRHGLSRDTRDQRLSFKEPKPTSPGGGGLSLRVDGARVDVQVEEELKGGKVAQGADVVHQRRSVGVGEAKVEPVGSP